MIRHLTRAEWLMLAAAALGGMISGTTAAIVTILITHV
jgi:hypothetical protein